MPCFEAVAESLAVSDDMADQGGVVYELKGKTAEECELSMGLNIVGWATAQRR